MTTGRWIEIENGKRKELDFEYKVQDDKECMKVWMQIDGCKETGNLDITFYSEVNDGMFPVMEVTEEFGVPMEKNRMFKPPLEKREDAESVNARYLSSMRRSFGSWTRKGTGSMRKFTNR